jgi:hypothetical protein
VLVLCQHGTAVIFRNQVSNRVSKAYEPVNTPTFTNIRVNTVESRVSEEGHAPISYLWLLCDSVYERCIFIFKRGDMPLQGSASFNTWGRTWRHMGGRLGGFHPKCRVYKSAAHR